MNLAGEQQRIQRHPEIVDDDVVDDLMMPVAGSDFDLGKVRVHSGRCRQHW